MSGSTVLADLTAQVEIPKDGTLSRVVFSDESIRVVAFGFDKGQELTDHTAGVPITIGVVFGNLTVVVDGQESEIGPKSWVHIRAGVSHAVRANEPSVMVLTLLKGEVS